MEGICTKLFRIHIKKTSTEHVRLTRHGTNHDEDKLDQEEKCNHNESFENIIDRVNLIATKKNSLRNKYSI